MWNKHGGINQQWDIVYVDEQKPEPKKGQMWPQWGFIVERPFYIVSELKKNRHFTQLNGEGFSIIKTPNANISQKFYFDQKTRTLRMVRDRRYSLVAKSNNQITYSNTRATPEQQFVYKDGYITNVKTKKAFDVSGGKDVETQKVVMSNKHNGANQRWRIVYVDTFKEQNKGLIEEFGLFANRPFYIKSQLPNGRMAECQGNHDVRQRRWRNGELGMQWIFDPIKKVIRSKKWNNRVLEPINHATGLGNMRCYTPSSRWW